MWNLPLLIPIVPRLYQSNGYIRRKLRTWRFQKCIALVGENTVLTSAWLQTTLFHRGSIGPRMEICGISGIQIPMVLHLHQSNGYIKIKLRAWRVQKCIALVGAETVLTSAWPETTPFHGGGIRPRMEICGTSALPIPMVPRLHQSNGYIERKLRAWRF